MWHSKEQLKTGKSGRNWSELEVDTYFSADYLKKRKIWPVKTCIFPKSSLNSYIGIIPEKTATHEETENCSVWQAIKKSPIMQSEPAHGQPCVNRFWWMVLLAHNCYYLENLLLKLSWTNRPSKDTLECTSSKLLVMVTIDCTYTWWHVLTSLT